MPGKEIEKHCAEIYKCNQRGGRMLSIIDLIKANTLSMDIAAFLLERVSNGDSFIVGANPGGAGKTTVMCALINCIPGNMQIFHAENLSAIESGKDKNPGCFICHEISRGAYYAYLWARELQEFFALKNKGHILAANLHADTYEQAKHQICVENEVPEINFYNINVLLFIKMEQNNFKLERKISSLWYSEKGEEHIEIFKNKNKIDSCKFFLEKMIKNDKYLIEDIREELLKWRK